MHLLSLVINMVFAFHSVATATEPMSKNIPHAQIDVLEESQQLTTELLELAGVRRYVRMALKEIQMASRQTAQRLAFSSDQLNQLDLMIRDLYRFDAFEKAIRLSVAQALSEGELSTLIAWYRAPLGSKIANAEISALQRPEAPSPHTAERKIASAERIQIISRLDSVAAATNTALEITLSALKNATVAMTEADLQHIQAQLHPKIQNETWLGMLYTYRNLSDGELVAYLMHLKQAEPQKFRRSIASALKTEMNRASKKLAAAKVAFRR